MQPSHNQGVVHFLRRGSFPPQEKPFLLRLDQDMPGLETTNYALEKVEIPIKDIRPRLSELEYEKHGFCVLNTALPLTYEEFNDSDKIESTYLRSISEAVRLRLEAASVVIIPHTIDSATDISTFGAQKADGVSTALYKIRRRHPKFPISTGERYEFEQPTNIAHVDVAREELSKVVQETFGSADGSPNRLKRHQWVNVWRPLKGPLSDWPLALCLHLKDTAPPDLEAVDVVFPDRVRDIELSYHAYTQEWFYLADQSTDECLLFLQGEVSEAKGRTRKGIPHASFDNKHKRSDESPRESIEVKLLVSYES